MGPCPVRYLFYQPDLVYAETWRDLMRLNEVSDVIRVASYSNLGYLIDLLQTVGLTF